MLGIVTGVYRLASDVELRYLPSGAAVAKLNLVNSSKYKTQSGEQKEDTCFINGTVFGKSAEILNSYCQKGSKIFIKAELKQDTWTDNNGQKRSAHNLKIDSFEFLDSKPNPNRGNGAAQEHAYNQNGSPNPRYDPNPKADRPAPTVEVVNNSVPDIDIDENEIPFN